MSETYSEYAVEVKKGLLSHLFLIEYETIFLDGTLEIAGVYNKARRKRRFICDMKEVEALYMGKRDGWRLGKITKDYSSRISDRDCCIIKVATEKGTHVVCFEPGEELEGIFRRHYRILMV